MGTGTADIKPLNVKPECYKLFQNVTSVLFTMILQCIFASRIIISLCENRYS